MVQQECTGIEEELKEATIDIPKKEEIINKDKGIKSRLIEIEKKIEEEEKKNNKKGKQKKFTLRRNYTMGHKQKVKKNYLLHILVRSNLTLVPKLMPVIDNKILRDGNLYEGGPEYILQWPKPLLKCIIQPEWSILPFNAGTHKLLTDAKGLSQNAQKLVISNVEHATSDLKQKPPFDSKTIFVIGVIFIVVLYLLSKVISGGTI